MSEMTATDAKNRFGQVLEMAQAEPVRIQKHGRDVGIMVSPEYFNQMQENRRLPRVNPLVVKLHAESKQRWGKVYEALAK